MADKESEFRLPPVKKRTLEWVVKLILPVLAVLGLGTGGYLGIKETAPAPSNVKEITDSVKSIEQSITRMEGRISSLADGAGRDKAETDRRITELQKAVDKLEGMTATRREIEALNERVRALESKIR